MEPMPTCISVSYLMNIIPMVCASDSWLYSLTGAVMAAPSAVYAKARSTPFIAHMRKAGFQGQ